MHEVSKYNFWLMLPSILTRRTLDKSDPKIFAISNNYEYIKMPNSNNLFYPWRSNKNKFEKVITLTLFLFKPFNFIFLLLHHSFTLSIIIWPLTE